MTTSPLKALAVAALAVLLVPAAASPHGGGIINDALQTLRSGDPVFVHQNAIPSLDPADAIALRERIAAEGGAVFVAVLPADAMHEAGTPDAVVDAVRRGLGVEGTYAVVVGGALAAVTRNGALGQDEAAHDAELALAAHRNDDLGSLLLDFVDRVTAEPAQETSSEGGGQSWLVWGLLAALGFGALILLATLARARRRSSVG
jgi:hypothetical protein